MLTVRIQEKNHSESIMVLKLKDGSENTIDFFLYNLISLCYTQNVEYSRGSGIGISNRFLITGDY